MLCAKNPYILDFDMRDCIKMVKLPAENDTEIQTGVIIKHTHIDIDANDLLKQIREEVRIIYKHIQDTSKSKELNEKLESLKVHCKEITSKYQNQ